jgi:hypothetical protein
VFEIRHEDRQNATFKLLARMAWAMMAKGERYKEYAVAALR